MKTNKKATKRIEIKATLIGTQPPVTISQQRDKVLMAALKKLEAEVSSFSPRPEVIRALTETVCVCADK